MAPQAKTKASKLDDLSDLQHNAPEPVVNEESYKFEESVNDMVDELLAERNHSIPPISDLLDEANRIEEAISGKKTAQDAEKSKKSREKVKVPVTESKHKETDDVNKTPTLSKKRIVQSEESKTGTSDPIDDDYQESFASQMETAEMRSEIESFAARMTSMESIIEGLLKERSNLPTHLERLNVSINQQFTVMNERLNAAIESGVMNQTLDQTSQDASVLAKSASNIIDTLHTDLTHQPTTSSQVAQPQIITGGRKKVRLVR